jgi:hypothetical protein
MAQFYKNDPNDLQQPIVISAKRNRHLPTLFQVKLHPLVSENQQGRTFVYVQDTTKDHMKKFAKWANERNIPSGTDTQVEEQGKTKILSLFGSFGGNTYHTGKFKLVVGDTIFAHNAQGSQEAKDDDI